MTFGGSAVGSAALASSGDSISSVSVTGSSTTTTSASGTIRALVKVEGVSTSTISATGSVKRVVQVTGGSTTTTSATGSVVFSATGAKLYIDRFDPDRRVIAIPVSPTPNINRGATASLSLRIKDDARQDKSTSYNNLKDLEEYAGFAQTGGTLSSVYFSESSNYPDSPVDSLLVRIEPGEKIDLDGVWGVVESVDDQTQILATGGRLTVDVFVLDALSEYSDKEAVRNDLEV